MTVEMLFFDYSNKNKYLTLNDEIITHALF